jgi:rubrerythrin
VLEGLDDNDLLGLYTYQFIAEGRAHRVWQKMADIIDDPKVAQAYQRIANDEKVHRDFGRAGLESLLESPAAQERAKALADNMRHALYEVSCMNCVEVPEARDICVQAYGSRYLKH